jgi:xanthine phosphoribosyltransferase
LEELRRRIQTEGRNLGKGILKVDSFINHQIDPSLMVAVGREMARRTADVEVTKFSRRRSPASLPRSPQGTHWTSLSSTLVRRDRSR